MLDYLHYVDVSVLVMLRVIRAYEPVDEVSNKAASSKTAYDGKRERCCRKTQTDSTDEDNSLKALTKDSDERQDEHCVLLGPTLETRCGSASGCILRLECLSQLYAPFVLQLRDPEECCTHKGDDQCGQDAERALPDVFSRGKVVFAKAIEGANHAASNDKTDEQAKANTPPHLDKGQIMANYISSVKTNLSNESLVYSRIALWTESLPEEGQQNRDDDACL